MPFAVLVLRDVFREYPDRDGRIGVGGRRLAPPGFLAHRSAAGRPAIAAAAVICFAFAWNEFLFGLILSYQRAIPVTVVIAGVEHTQGVQFQGVATRLLLAILPPAILAAHRPTLIVRG